MAKKFGPKWPILLSVLIACSLTICTPFVAPFGWKLTCVLRIFQGSAQGFINPSIQTLISKWLHPTERGYASLIYAGGICGTVVTLTLSGIIVSSPLGWPAVFFYTGGLGFLWALLFVIFGTNTPAEYKTISLEEKNFIQSMPGVSIEKLPTPWKKMLCSKPCWAIFIGYMTQNWSQITMIAYIPSYIYGILDFDIQSV